TSNLLSRIIRRVFNNRYIMRMAFAHAGCSDADELGALQRVNIGRSAITHACAQAANELEHFFAQRSLVRHPTNDAFGNKLACVVCAFLEVAVFASLAHGFYASHPAIYFVLSSLVDDGF